MSILEPISTLYSSEKSISSKKVLLAESNKKQQIIAKMALGGTGVSLDIVNSLEDGKEKIDEKSYDLLVTDTDLLGVADYNKDKNPNCSNVLMTSKEISHYLEDIGARPYLKNIVTRNEEDRTFTVKTIVSMVTKILSGSFFGMEKYLAWGVDVVEKPVQSSKDRQNLIEEMASYFKNIGMRKSTIERCSLASEEMLMNAIYDAPVDKEGRSIYNHKTRQEQIDLKENEESCFRFACDGILAAVSVSDPFGALDLNIILKYLESCYSGAAGEMNKQLGKGGAGRGLHQIIETADLVIFNIRPKEKTEVIALFSIDKKLAEGFQSTSFHYYQT